MTADIKQFLYLGALMDGLKFTITDVTAFVPDATGWTATFTSDGSGKRQNILTVRPQVLIHPRPMILYGMCG